MKALFIGGVKSGKSRHAEQFCLTSSPTQKPIYLATTAIGDSEMQQRIVVHQERRKDQFITIEEPLALSKILQTTTNLVLLECVTMWLNNMLYYQKTEAAIWQELESLFSLSNSIVFVLNEVGWGIIPDNALSRQFVDISGQISQWLGEQCEIVYCCVAGQKFKIK